MRANTGSSIYHSLQASFDRRFTRGLSGGAHYTYSSFIDNGSEVFSPSSAEVATPQDPFNRNAGERARSTYDRPHRATGNVIYELPFKRDQAGAAGVPVRRVADGEPVGARSRELHEDARSGEAEHAGGSGPGQDRPWLRYLEHGEVRGAEDGQKARAAAA